MEPALELLSNKDRLLKRSSSFQPKLFQTRLRLKLLSSLSVFVPLSTTIKWPASFSTFSSQNLAILITRSYPKFSKVWSCSLPKNPHSSKALSCWPSAECILSTSIILPRYSKPTRLWSHKEKSISHPSHSCRLSKQSSMASVPNTQKIWEVYHKYWLQCLDCMSGLKMDEMVPWLAKTSYWRWRISLSQRWQLCSMMMMIALHQLLKWLKYTQVLSGFEIATR